MGAKPFAPLLFRARLPCTPGVASPRLASERSDGGRLKSTRCSKVPFGASGSSTMMATLFAFDGTTDHEIGGETLRPSQVYSLGIIPPSLKAVDVTVKDSTLRACALAANRRADTGSSHFI